MGTTRMHPDPRKGVVDDDCRVHGTANLFIAGPSVFPTGGYANPTLTIVALAFSAARPRAIYLGAKTWIDRFAGGIVGLLGGRLVLEALRSRAA